MFKINIYALSILLCLGSSTAMPMQTSSLQDLTHYVIPTVKILAGASCLKYLAALDTKHPVLKKILGRTDIDYKSETVQSTGRKQGFSLSIHINAFPIIAGLYLIKSGIQDFRNV